MLCRSKLGKAGEEPCSAEIMIGFRNFLLSALRLSKTDCLERAIFALITALVGKAELLADFYVLSFTYELVFFRVKASEPEAL